MKESDILSIVIIRHVPLGPFTLVNAILGSMHLDFGRYLVANGLSFTPSIVGAALLSNQLQRLLHGL